MSVRPFIFAFVLLLAACAHPNRMALQNAVDSLDSAVLDGRKAPESALDAYQALYKKYPSEPITVSAYADALRRSQKPSKAAQVLRPFVENTDTNKLPGPTFLAYIRLMIDQGYNREAEMRLRKRLEMPAKHDKNDDGASLPQLYNLLGVTLANQDRKTEAEQAFRTALVHWDGRPGVVEKNLARLQQSK